MVWLIFNLQETGYYTLKTNMKHILCMSTKIKSNVMGIQEEPTKNKIIKLYK